MVVLGNFYHKTFPITKQYIVTFVPGRKKVSGSRFSKELRIKVRRSQGRTEIATAAIIDSQSVKTTEIGGSERGAKSKAFPVVARRTI